LSACQEVGFHLFICISGTVHTEAWWGNRRQRSDLRDLTVDGDNTKVGLQELDGGKDLFLLAEDRELWRAILNAVMNLRFPYNVGNFLAS
jgi:hypothetical protein